MYALKTPTQNANGHRLVCWLNSSLKRHGYRARKLARLQQPRFANKVCLTAFKFLTQIGSISGRSGARVWPLYELRESSSKDNIG